MNTLLMATRFSSESLASMIVIALICTAVPFIFLGYYRAKTGAKLSSFFIGMAFYVLFAFGAEGFLNMLLFNFFSLADVFNRSTHPVWYALYGAVAAGIFEEIGKYVGLSRFMKNRPGKQNAFLFGVGHGGFETIAYGSSLFMGNIVLAFMVNSLGMDNYLAKLNLSGEALADYKTAIAQLIAVPPIENVAAGVERILALFFQAALAVLIYIAVNDKKRKYFLPVAIVLHIIGYVPTYLTQVGVIKNLALSMCLSGAVTVLTACYAYRTFQERSD
ncbi:MAG: YhfC family intramembrane metalloprotease [Roseburia sp.]|nr:YhfC family intramembrane metalloprotease [Roseburia sp.]